MSVVLKEALNLVGADVQKIKPNPAKNRLIRQLDGYLNSEDGMQALALLGASNRSIHVAQFPLDGELGRGTVLYYLDGKGLQAAVWLEADSASEIILPASSGHLAEEILRNRWSLKPGQVVPYIRREADLLAKEVIKKRG